MERVLKNAFDRAFLGCVGGEVAQVSRLIAIARQAALNGMDVGADAVPKREKCLRFELDYELVLRYRKSSGNMERFDLVVESKRAPLRLSTSTGKTEGPVPLAVPVWAHFDNICDREGGTATVIRPGHAELEINLNLKYTVDGKTGLVTNDPVDPSVKVPFDPGDVAVTSFCGIGDKGYYDTFRNFLYPDLVDPLNPARLMLRNWTYPVPKPWAQIIDVREKTGPQLGGVASGSLTMRLHHTPDRTP